MRRPAMRTPMRGSRGRNPTPLPSRPVRKVPKTPPKPRPVRGGSDIGTPRGQRPTKTGPYGGRVPATKTTPNTGTSTKTAQLQKFNKKAKGAMTTSAQKAALIAAQQAKLANKAPTQKQPTGSRAAAMRRRQRSGGLAGALRRARRR